MSNTFSQKDYGKKFHQRNYLIKWTSSSVFFVLGRHMLKVIQF